PPVAADLAPVLVAQSPARGAAMQPDDPIELIFDRPMNQAATAAALTVGPGIAGMVSWPDARTLRFTPDQPLQRAEL
ncbi:MAG TPA: Ig-like domain-containing protein, partial [Roseiflexaceae bacterium]|nr:Ig-like domain-containing protein [Roseiflexaceae bacterium]